MCRKQEKGQATIAKALNRRLRKFAADLTQPSGESTSERGRGEKKRPLEMQKGEERERGRLKTRAYPGRVRHERETLDATTYERGQLLNRARTTLGATKPKKGPATTRASKGKRDD